MNYYERHLGDYAKDTAHLTMLEHGAYGLLLDRYYGTEQGIPADQAHRVARARTKEERAAVDAVLAEFFTLVDGLWVNGRAAREIAKAQTKIEAARENGKLGGRPKKNPDRPPDGTKEKPTGFPLGSSQLTQPKTHQTPDTSNQIQESAIGIPTPRARPPGDGPGSPGIPECPAADDPAMRAVVDAVRAAGYPEVSVGDPLLRALVAQGLEPEEAAAAAKDGAKAGCGWGWVVGRIKGRRDDAARLVLGKPAAVAEARPWHATRSGIEAKGQELGLGRWDEAAAQLGRGEQFGAYEARVLRAAGLTLRVAV